MAILFMLLAVVAFVFSEQKVAKMNETQNKRLSECKKEIKILEEDSMVIEEALKQISNVQKNIKDIMVRLAFENPIRDFPEGGIEKKKLSFGSWVQSSIELSGEASEIIKTINELASYSNVRLQSLGFTYIKDPRKDPAKENFDKKDRKFTASVEIIYPQKIYREFQKDLQKNKMENHKKLDQTNIVPDQGDANGTV